VAPRPPREVEVEEDREDLEDKELKGKDKLLDDTEDDEPEDEGLDNEEARREQAEEARRKKAAEPDEDEEDLRLAYSEEDEDSRGGSRRQRRNRARREALQQKDRVIEALAGEIQNLKGAFDQMSRGQLNLAAVVFKDKLRTENDNLRRIDVALADAVKNNDGDTYARAIRLRDEARDRIADIEAARYRLAQQVDPQRPQQQQRETPQSQQRQAPDPRAVRYSEKFMDRNPWFDPNGTDEDSQVLKAIDNALAAEGLKPHTGKYWAELERRAKARGLGQDHEEYGNDMDDEDDGEQRQERRPAKRNGGLPPRAGRSGGGRQPGTGFTLTPMMRDTLDQLGLLEEKGLNEDQVKTRRKYVKQWREGLKAAAPAL